MNIGRNIKKRRLELSLTLEDVAKRIGTSKQTIQRYEQGIISNIPHDKIEALANALITSPSRLMGWVESDFNTSFSTCVFLSEHEANVIAAYSDNKEMQKAIDVLLGMDKSQNGK